MNTTARMTLSFAVACVLAAPAWADEVVTGATAISSEGVTARDLGRFGTTAQTTVSVSSGIDLQAVRQMRRELDVLDPPKAELPALILTTKDGRKWRAKWEEVNNQNNK